MKHIFREPLQELYEYEELRTDMVKNRGPLQAGGCLESQKAHLLGALMDQVGCGCHLVVTYSEKRAKELSEDLALFAKNVWLYPAKDMLFYAADVQGSVTAKARLSAVRQLAEYREEKRRRVAETAGKPDAPGRGPGQGTSVRQVTVVTTIDGLMDHLQPMEDLVLRSLTIEVGQEVETAVLTTRLVKMGYERVGQVESAGQFSVRGGIVDIFPLTEEQPVRMELFGDEVDSIRSFDAESQRSIENLNQVTIYPASDSITSLDGAVSFLDYFPAEDTDIYLDEPARLAEKARVTEEEFRESMINRLEKGLVQGMGQNPQALPGDGMDEPVMDLFSGEVIFAALERGRTLCLSALDQAVRELTVTRRFSFSVRNVNSYQNSVDTLIQDLKAWKRNGCKVVLLCASRTRAARLAGDLREYDLRAYYREDTEEDRPVLPGEICVAYGSLHRGFEYPLIKYVVITEGEIFGREKTKKRRKTRYEGKRIQSFTELSPGDYVVHENHGLGIYRGIEKVEVDHIVKDYIKIEYRDGGNLYLPVTQLSLVQKYAGSEGRRPKLNRLGGEQWNKTKSRVKSAVKEIAADLVKLYAARQQAEGFHYSEDTVWQREFEELFPYEETEDQLAAIEAVKKDMESGRIMDRLICGDVGYGKTEVALRAAFKAIQDGKQVVYLVPTTILAQQHYNTFCQRMGNYPVRVELMSRFRSASEQKKVLADLRKGLVDVVIGTHRVLSKDMVYKDLGLLIIDEEQRFGVTHKEKIKQLKESVDVLTLTATPIPRTLHMSLIGIRDMSVLEEPPMDRIPIQTYVMEYNEELVREAITRELVRGGQIYYVYNRVRGIDELANRIAALAPEANVAFAHGQMVPREMERIMTDFVGGEIDVLVSTTIIETGLDISNVNTIIIHDADRYGLSQLYQLRGRVGRSNRTAYAFLMYPRGRMLKEEAEKRLAAIREFTELGSGIRIAMRDLELRGAGNLLGAEQHGHMDAVGYDLYCKLLGEAVQVLKGEALESPEFETTVDFDMDAYIPPFYIRSESQKLDVYKRIAAIENDEELEDMQDELTDRFGDLPGAVSNLLKIAEIRAMAHQAGVTAVTGNALEIKAVMYARAGIDVARIPELIRAYGGNLKLTNAAEPFFTLKPRRGAVFRQEELLAAVKKLLIDIKMLLD
ncbi:MAG: transcription-repair coupling factor [Lachnospiraceae bacterium]|nr:transcription-repair coupling factor [Lachnospiraceae bacterium]